MRAIELHAKDTAASLRTIGGITLDPWVTGDDGSFTFADEVLTNRVHRGVSFPIGRSR
jgi:hypothetical protein